MKGPSRRRVREIALQAIYEIKIGRQEPTKVLNRYITEEDIHGSSKLFLRGMVRGTIKNIQHIDLIIEELSRGWKLERIAKVDLSILRLSMFEILVGLKEEVITDAIIINEAVVLAKKFSGKDAGKFVNGILATLIKQKKKWKDFLRQQRKDIKDE